jgi:hypothetical protein
MTPTEQVVLEAAVGQVDKFRPKFIIRLQLLVKMWLLPTANGPSLSLGTALP